LPDAGEVTFRSPASFVIWRCLLACGVVAAISFVLGATVSPIRQVAVAVLGALVLGAVVYRLSRARVLVTSDSVLIYGPFRDRVLRRSDVVDCGAVVVWYFPMRRFVPVMLTLTTREAGSLPVAAVQSFVANAGFLWSQAHKRAAQSYTAAVAAEISRLIHT
jgi:hypothetical protein